MPKKINLELYKEVHAYLQDHTYNETAKQFKISEMQISRIKKYFKNQQSKENTSDNLLLKQLYNLMLTMSREESLTNEEEHLIEKIETVIQE